MPLFSPQLAMQKMLLVRRGFSLIELLVVISIIAVMAGLVVSSLFRNRDSNRLLAAEHMLADTIRQARHTARSTNAPVELRIESVTNGSEVIGARVSGVTRIAIWGETFDGDGQVLPPHNTEQGGLVIGRSGNGRVANPDHPIPMHHFERGQALVRGSRSDGFYIACQVRPPLTAAYVPLIMIGDSDDYDLSQCGLELTRVRNQWEVRGWVRGEDSESPTYVSTLNPANRPLGHKKLEENQEYNGALISGLYTVAPERWVDLGLLYDGERLILFANGKRIAVHHGDVPKKLIPGAGVIMGQVTFKHVSQNYLVEVYAHDAPLDDIRLYRLGTSDVGELPGNVVLVPGANQKPDPALGYRILCHGDGRVEVFRDDDENKRAINDRADDLGYSAADDATITLAQRLAPGSLQYVTVRIGLDGRVTSSMVTKAIATPGPQQ